MCTELAYALGTFDQVARQTADRLKSQAAAGRITVRGGAHDGRPADAAAATADALDRARPLAALLADTLGEASNAAAFMTTDH